MKLPRWIRDDKKRAILAFLGTGAATIIGGMWVLSTYMQTPDVRTEVTYTLCVGPNNKWCPADAIYLKGYVPMALGANATTVTRNTVADWVNRECAQYRRKNTFWGSGGMEECDCAVVQVKCTSG